MTAIPNLLSAALQYIKRGWHVFPLHNPTDTQCSCGRNDCQKVGKHPRTPHGLKDATTDEDQIRSWWTKWPLANIGIATGAISGLLVLDVDDGGTKSGSASLAALEGKHGALPVTLSSQTGHGRHLYFRHPGGTLKNSTSKLGSALDVRADRGYVIAPPSLHENGRHYAWVDETVTLADPPDWLVTRLREEDVAVTGLVPIGARNNSLARLAGRCRARGMDRDGIEEALLDANAMELETPLPATEVRGIAASVSRYQPGKKRLPWFQFFPNEWFASNAVRLGRDQQRGWLIQLLAECWRRGGHLPNDDEMLWRFAGAESRDAFEANGEHLLVLDEFILTTLEDGTEAWVHPWMANHYAEQSRKYQQRCEAAAKSAARRRGELAPLDFPPDPEVRNDLIQRPY